MTDEELIARLRELRGTYGIGDMAADRMEALKGERDQWIEHTKNAVWSDSEELKLANARVERLEEALRSMLEAAKFMYYGTAFEKDFRDEIAALKGADHE